MRRLIARLARRRPAASVDLCGGGWSGHFVVLVQRRKAGSPPERSYTVIRRHRPCVYAKASSALRTIQSAVLPIHTPTSPKPSLIANRYVAESRTTNVQINVTPSTVRV